MFYDPQKKRIVNYGSNKPCGHNHNRYTIHAEQCAIEYCRKYDKKNKYQIYISRFDKEGSHKPTYCCNACTKLVKKYNFQNRIFTINKDKIINPIISKPTMSLAFRIKHDLKY